MKLPPGLSLYRAASTAAGALAPGWLNARARRGKEDPARLGERFGRASLPRPAGVLAWLHAASVGEAKVALQMIDALALARPDAHFLLTTGTTTAARVVAAALPARALHQYAPLDRPDCAARFLGHWRPQLAVFAESELWPNTILAAHEAGAALALINARLSPKSLANWARLRHSAHALLSAFSEILAADRRTADGLSALTGRTIACVGNLKLAAAAPKPDAESLAALQAAAAGRAVWLAASTHQGEDEIVIAAHADISAARPGALLIIAPRHPERGGAIAALANKAPQRSLGATPQPHHSVYVADTIGEMATLYALAPVTVMGGSLRPELKGHNPIEAAQLGSATLSGPHVESFADIFDALIEAGGVEIVAGADAIAASVLRLWDDGPARATLCANAGSALALGGPALERTRAALLGLLPEAAHATA